MEPELRKKEEKKNKRKVLTLFLSIAVVLVIAIGGVFALYSSNDTFENEFKTAKYGAEVTENFVSPKDWQPGDETDKDVKVKNTGSICENVRVSYIESWKDANNNPLPLEKNGIRGAIINFDNTADWVKDGKYYYYQADLMPGEETNSFIKSVTYNPDVNNGYTCEVVGNTKTCTVDGNGYAGGTYTLTIKVDTIECDKKTDGWGYAMFDAGKTVNAKIKTMVAGASKRYDESDNTAEKMLWSNSLPNDFEATTANIVSASTSPKPIYAWYDDNEKTVYFYTEPEEIYFNQDSSNMFYNFRNVTDLSMIETLDTNRVTNMSQMFAECSNLTTLDLSNLDTGKVTNMFYMFQDCRSLITLDLSNLDTSNVTNMNSMFYNCSNLTTLDLSNFDTSSVTNMSRMFNLCSKLTTLDLSHFDKSNVQDMSGMFTNCSNLTTLDLSNFDTSNLKNMSWMFTNCSNLTTLDLSNFDTSSVTNMSSMFQECNSLISLDLSSFDTSSVINMSQMFHKCISLTSLDLSHFDTSSVTNMKNMFSYCNGLVSIDVSHFNTSNVTTMGSMFYECNSLAALDVSHFDTSNVTTMNGMFRGCKNLTNLDVSHFNTSKVTTMVSMFNTCSKLTSLDLSSFDTSSVTEMSVSNNVNYGMFSGCTNLETIYVSNTFVTTAVTDSTGMFYRCTKLVGGNGTTYDSTIIDQTRAVIDTAGTPGYFTEKSI